MCQEFVWEIYSADMSNSIESAIAIAIFGTIAITKVIFQLLLFAIGIVKAISKLLLITSFFYIEVCASQIGLKGTKRTYVV